MASKGDAASAATGPLSLAADRLRESARWLVVAFGAVAAVVFAGIGVSRFGDLDPDTAPGIFFLAVLAALLSVVGALGALFVAMGLAAASTVSVSDLLQARPEKSVKSAKKSLSKAPLLSTWNGSFTDFFAEVDQANKTHQIALKGWAESDEIDPTPNFVNRAAERLESLDNLQSSVLEAASYLRLRERFKAARWSLAGSLLLATASAVAFVWATGDSADEHVPLTATAALWSVPSGDKDRITPLLGEECPYELTAVPVIVLGNQGEGKEIEIVTGATGACAPVRLVVPSGELRRSTAAP